MAGIEMDCVSKSFTGHAAVREATLSVRDGEFITLLGPSGCGKTTTLRMIAGFLEPDDGTISVGGRVLSGPGWAVDPQDRDMGMVFQNYALWPHKNVFSNVAYGLKMKRVPRKEQRQRVGEMLDVVGLSGLEERSPDELSGGQQQRVALARSLVTQPRILLLDEPLSNLDAKLRDRMRAELQDIQRQTGVTFVYVTHDQSEALSMSDRIAVLDQGNVEQFDTPRAVYQRPANVTVASFMGVANFLDGYVSTAQPECVTVVADRLGALRIPREGVCADLVAGERVSLAIRPESIELIPSDGIAASGTDVAARGTVARASLLGSTTLASIDLGGVSVQAQLPGHTELLSGQQIRITVRPEQTNVYRSEDASHIVNKQPPVADAAGVAG